MHSNWLGYFTDGQTAALRTAEVSFDGQFLVIRDVAPGAGLAPLARWNIHEVTVEPGGPPDSFELRTSDQPEAALHLTGASLAEELSAIGLQLGGLTRDPRRRTILGLVLIAGIVGFVGLVWLSITPISKAIALAIPLEYERALSGRVERAFAEYHCESAPAAEVLDGLVVRLAGPDHGLPSVHVLNLGLPNAFALPGGGVVLTRGLLETAESSDEVAGVLAHEIEHVAQRHVLTALIRGTLLSSLWAVTAGDYAGVLVIDPTTAFQLATQKFSREDEASADRGALLKLEHAGIRRQGIRDFFDRLAKAEGDVPEWLSTHPPSSERADAAQEASADDADLQPALDQHQWDLLSNACKDATAPEMELQDLFF